MRSVQVVFANRKRTCPLPVIEVLPRAKVVLVACNCVQIVHHLCNVTDAGNGGSTMSVFQIVALKTSG